MTGGNIEHHTGDQTMVHHHSAFLGGAVVQIYLQLVVVGVAGLCGGIGVGRALGSEGLDICTVACIAAVNLIIDCTDNCLPLQRRLAFCIMTGGDAERCLGNQTDISHNRADIFTAILEDDPDLVVITITRHCRCMGVTISGGGKYLCVGSVFRSRAEDLIVIYAVKLIPLQSRLTRGIVAGSDLNGLRRCCVGVADNITFNNRCAVFPHCSDLIIIGIACDCRSMGVGLADGGIDTDESAVRSLRTENLILLRIADSVPGQGGLAIIVAAHNSIDSRIHIRHHIGFADRFVGLSINDLAGTDAEEHTGSILPAHGVAKLHGGIDFIPSLSIGRGIDHIGNLRSLGCTPGNNCLAAVGLHRGLSRNIRSDLISDRDLTRSIAAPAIQIGVLAVSACSEGDGCGTYIHIVLVSGRVIREIRLAGLGQNSAVRRSGGGSGRSFLAIIGADVVGQLYIHIRHLNSQIAAQLTYIGAIGLLYIIMATSIIIIDALDRAGFRSVDTMAVNDTGRRHFVCRQLLTDACFGIVIVYILHILDHPASVEQAIHQVEFVALCIGHDTGVLLLANVDTIFAEVVIVAVDLADTGILITVFIVGETAAFHDPAFLNAVEQGVLVFEVLVNRLEVATILLHAIFTDVGEGIQAVDLLVLWLLREGIQGVCTQIDVVSNGAAVHDHQSVIAVPFCIALGSQCNTGHDTHGVGCINVDGFFLSVPLHDQCQAVLLIVEDGFLQIEVLVVDGQFGVIHIHVLIKVQDGSNFRQNTDSFCQLQQEAPGCIVAFHIRAGQHVGQILQLSRHLDLAHIHGEGVGGLHGGFSVDGTVHVGTLHGGVGHLTDPGQLQVTAACILEVEAGLILGIHCQGDGTGNGGIAGQRCSYLNASQTGCFITDETQSIDGTVGCICRAQYNVIFVEGHGLTFVCNPNRQLGWFAVDCIDGGLLEVDIVRGHNIDLLGADDHVVQLQLNLRCASGASGEDTVVGDGTDAAVGNSPYRTLRHIHNIAGNTDSCCGEGAGGIHSEVAVIAINNCTVEGGGVRCGRNHQQRGGNGTGDTVGRLADDAQSIRAGFLSDIGTGTAAVQVHCHIASCLQHDLSNFFHVTAAGQVTLTAVQDHKDHFTGCRDTHSRTACAVAAVGGNDLTITDQVAESSNCLTDTAGTLCLQSLELSHGTDPCSTVIQNGEETICVNGMVGHAVHNQDTTGFTGVHIVACAVDTCNDIIVLDVVGAVRIAVLLLGYIGLVNDTLHIPAAGRIVVMVVCVNVDSAAGKITGGSIVDHGLAVGGIGMVDLLDDTRSQRGGFRLEHRVECVLLNINEITGQFGQVVCHNIAAGLAQFGNVGGIEGTCAFQSCYDTVGQVLIVNSIPDIGTECNTAQALIHEVCSTLRSGQRGSHVAGENLGQRAVLVLTSIEGLHHIECIQVAFHIGVTEGTLNRLFREIFSVLQEVLGVDLLDHILKGCGFQTKLVDHTHQVNSIAGPAGNVGMVFAGLIGVSDIHGTEDVADISPVSVGQTELMDVLQAGNLHHLLIFSQGFIVFFLVFTHILGKIRILVASHHVPGTGIIAVNTGTDILDDKHCRILAGSYLLYVGVCNVLQDRQILDKVIKVVDLGLTQGGNRNHGVVITSATGLVCFPTGAGIGRLLAGVVHNIVTQRRFRLSLGTVTGFACKGPFTLVFTVGQSCHAAFVPDVLQLFNGLLSNQDLVTDGAVLAFGLTLSSTGGSYSLIGHFGMTQCLHDFLRNQDLVADRAVLAFRLALSGTVRSHCGIDYRRQYMPPCLL